MQNACAILYCHLWRVRLYHIFLLYLINDTIFEKSVAERKMCFDFFLQILSETFLTLRGIQPHAVTNSATYCHKFSHILSKIQPHTVTNSATYCHKFSHILSQIQPHTVTNSATYCHKFSHMLSQIQPHTITNSATYCHKCTSVFMWSTLYFCQILINLEFYQQMRKIPKCQISWKSAQWEPSCSMRTEW